MKKNRQRPSSPQRRTAVLEFNRSIRREPTLGSTVHNTLQTWLGILFSVMWMGIGIAGLVFINNVDLGGRTSLVIGPLLLLALFMFCKGAYMFITSVISLFRSNPVD